ncbi:MAG TPA: hypothetical protein VMT16_17070 [Thermoanaerobaculia bacterium]|nr:hypothetical protein [Thermoanaerobaculia bacterium]
MGTTARTSSGPTRGAWRRFPALLCIASALAAAPLAGEGPEPLAPAGGASVDPAADRLAWTAVEGASGYRVRVAPLEFPQRPAAALATAGQVAGETVATELPLDAVSGLLSAAGYAWAADARLGDRWQAGAASYFNVRFPGQTVTRAGAVSLLVHRVLVAPTLARPANAWLGRVMLQPGQAVEPFEQPEARREVGAPTWFGWIDDDPYAFFAHPGRFVFVDAASGEVEVVPVSWWPLLDGESLWMDDAAQADLEVRVYVERLPPLGAP